MGLLPWGLFLGCGLLRATFTASLWAACGDLHTLPMRCRGTACSTMGLSMGCRELLLHTWSTSFPPSALTLLSSGLICSYLLIPLSHLLLCNSFSPFFNLLTLGQQPDTSGAGFHLTWGSYWTALRGHFCSTPPTTKTLSYKHNIHTNRAKCIS